MRINTDGKKEWRSDLYERTAETLDENTMTGAIDSACIHANQDLDAKQETIDYLKKRLPPDELKRVAELLSTDKIRLQVDIDTSVSVSE
jgi:hypothetical protein